MGTNRILYLTIVAFALAAIATIIVIVAEAETSDISFNPRFNAGVLLLQGIDRY